MRIVFMGTPRFAELVLEELLQSDHEVVAVVTRPDAIRGRGKKLVSSPVKACAQRFDIPVLEYSSLKSEEAYQALINFHAEVFCVAAYGALLPKRILELPRFGCLNVHGSLLPRWRGAAPIERAILAGDHETGIGIMRMEEGLDTGDVASTAVVEIEQKTAPDLSDELACVGGKCLVSVLDTLDSGTEIHWKEQSNEGITYADKLAKGELDIAPELTCKEALLRVQASSDNHPCRCEIAGKKLTILKACLASQDIAVPCGEISFSSKRLYLGLSDGVIELEIVKPDGKKTMEAKAFAAGIQGIEQGGITWSALNA